MIQHNRTLENKMNLIEAVGIDWLERHIDEALAEDLGQAGDITCHATIPAPLQARAELVCKQAGIIAGSDWAVKCGERTVPEASWVFTVRDGERVEAGDVIAEVTGSLRGILISERTALNGLGRLSGIATMTAEAMRRIKGTNAVVLETRKTTPGWRKAEKYAVRMGGAENHRMGLYDEILIKENHIDAAGGILNAIEGAKKWRQHDLKRKNIPIEIEVKNLEELETALEGKPERILLDNFNIDLLNRAVQDNSGECVLEASGGITLDNIESIAHTGVERISLGALTHSVKPLDLSLLVFETS